MRYALRGPAPYAHGYSGPFRAGRARKEVARWRADGCLAVLLPNTPEVRARVRDWQVQQKQQSS